MMDYRSQILPLENQIIRLSRRVDALEKQSQSGKVELVGDMLDTFRFKDQAQPEADKFVEEMIDWVKLIEEMIDWVKMNSSMGYQFEEFVKSKLK